MSDPKPRPNKVPKGSYWRACAAVAVAVLASLSVVYVLIQLAQIWKPIFPPNLPATYLAAAAFPCGVALCFLIWFPRWLSGRRSVDEAEIDGLFAEIGRYGASSGNEKAIEHAKEEREKLKALGRSVLELDVLALREALVDLYHPEEELISKVRRELELLEEYASVGEDDLAEESSKRINKTINNLNKILEDKPADTNNGDGNRRKQFTRTLRAELKTLRVRVAWYDNTWARGEGLRQSVSWSALAALFSTFLIGILPLVHSKGDLNIGLLHWTSLGACGALLALVLQLQQLDLPELGETGGKQLLQGAVRSLAIGAVSAALLYFALLGEAVDGKAFPNLPTRLEAGGQIDLEMLQNIALSAFWAILAGASPVVLRRLTRIADTTLGESKGDGEGE